MTPTPTPTGTSTATGTPAPTRTPSPTGTPSPHPSTPTSPHRAAGTPSLPLAVIGMAGRFPGAADVEEFWQAIVTGTVSTAGGPPPPGSPPDLVMSGGRLAGVDEFDAAFFGVSAREAALTDPQHRLLLQTCYHALEDGGYVTARPDTRIGVWAGTGMNLHAQHTYLLTALAERGPAADTDPVTALQTAIGNQPDFAASRVAFRLGLTGPAVAVQTACSTGLVAVHTAATALAVGDADVALVAAAAVAVPQDRGYRHVEGSILSRRGRCAPFSADADGTVGGNGVVAVLLKPLAAALADGDRVHAVVRGTAINNDGAGKVGFTAPSAAGQAAVVRRALDRAGLSAADIGYVETHGTGTALGDPIEVAGLTRAFRADTDRTGFCALGSVKANIGHLDSAAGLAGLVKAILVLRHRHIPPQPHLNGLNPSLNLDAGPFTVSATGRDWITDRPRRAGVCALGVGGTNAHVILEEAPPAAAVPAPDRPPPGVLPLSAHHPDALTALATRYRDRLRADPAADPAAVLAGAVRGRPPRPHRLTVPGTTATALADALTAHLDGTRRLPVGAVSATRVTPVLLFSGQGTGTATGLRALYARSAPFRDTLDACEAHQRDTWADGLLGDVLDEVPAADPLPTERWQPALFALQVALTAHWRALGIEPDLVVGHSVGEYAAQAAAGALSIADGLYLTTARGRLMRELSPPGGLLAVFAPRAVVDAVLAEHDELDLAVVNGAAHHVLAGPVAAVDAAEHALETAGTPARRVPAQRAFHSRLVDAVVEAFADQLDEVDLAPLRVPLLSSVDGQRREIGWCPDAAYLSGQLRDPVRFDQVLAALPAAAVLLEVGPSAALTRIAARERPDLPAVASLRGPDAVAALSDALGGLYRAGIDPGWAALTGAAPPWPAPAYPFLPTRHWAAPGPAAATSTAPPLPPPAAAPPAPHLATAPPAPHLATAPPRPAAAAPPRPAAAAALSAPPPAIATAPPASPSGAGPETTETDPAVTPPAPAPAAAPPDTAAALHDHVLDAIRERAARHLGLAAAEIADDVAFVELGADSLGMVNMLREVERTFAVRVSMRELFETADSPAALTAAVLDRLDPATAAALVAPPEVAELSAAPPAVPAADVAAVPAAAPAAAVAAVPAAAPPYPDSAAPPPPVSAAPSTAPAGPPAPLSAAPTPATPTLTAPVPGAGAAVIDPTMGAVVERQLQVMAQLSGVMAEQLTALRGLAPATPPAAVPAAPAVPSVPPASTVPPAAPPHQTAALAPAASGPTSTSSPATSSPATSSPATPNPAVHGPRVSVPRTAGQPRDLQQQAHLRDLIAAHTAATATSKDLTQRYRSPLADSRAVVGFRSATKELLYPLAARRAHGARLEDVDGHTYLDITMGFGILLFGHEPEFVTAAVARHLADGIRLGPRGEETGRAAELLCRLTGMDRAAFTTSGTEAISVAIRLARAHTGRAKIVMFDGSYHGHLDTVLARGVPGENDGDGGHQSVPVSAGIPDSAVAETTVLDYCSDESLAVIDRMGPQLAAVLVEPVQSRHPGRRPAEFLARLREITTRHGIVLLFDEMLTGFRPHVGGAQALFGVRADLACYGKVLGGGFPIGAVAGRAEIMDWVDGGHWRFGDDSFPPQETTFVGGTYMQHPLAMTAACAVLEHLDREGPALQEQLNARTTWLAEHINTFCATHDIALRVAHFGSLFRFEYRGNFDLLFPHLLRRGVHVWEWRNFFLSTAHTDADVAALADAVTGALGDLRRGGVLPGGPIEQPVVEPVPVGVAAAAAGNGSGPPRGLPGFPPNPATLDLSLYFFGDYPDGVDAAAAYRLLHDCATWADTHDLHAVWLPERHFHSFGGIFPSPSVLASSLATATQRIRINAGSVVLPLHDPIRVAEEWSVVDNLSGGRIGLGCASGWASDDFVFYPERYGRHRELLLEQIDTVRALWRGETITKRSGSGKQVDVGLRPRPYQPEPPMAVAVVSNPASWTGAARRNLGVVTNLMTQTPAELAANIAAYRAARAAAGLDPAAGRVTVLLHTYLRADAEQARAEALDPFRRYLRSSLSLFGQATNSLGFSIDLDETPAEDVDYLLEMAFDRYCADRALIGSPDSVAAVVDTMVAAGVDEIAAFVDFGAAPEQVRAGLPHLGELRDALPHRSTHHSPALDPTTLDPTVTPDTTVAPGTTAAPDPTSVIDSAPLSFAQEPLWFAERLLPGRATYNEVKAVALDGPLDVDALGAALQAVVDRHAALRTVFRDVHPGDPRQVVLAHVATPLPVHDHTGADPEVVLRDALTAEGGRRFDLAQGPLLHAHLLRLAADRHVLVLSLHHLIIDTVSAFVLTRELSALYRAGIGTPGGAELAPLSGSYTRYARAQRAELDSATVRAGTAYWCAQLRAPLPPSPLRGDHPRPPVPGPGRSHFRVLDAELSTRLRRFSGRQRATLFMTLLTGFAAVLRRHGGHDEMVIGMPVSGRPDDGSHDDLVGFFVNTLALRLDLSGRPGFAEALGRVRGVLLDAQDHAHAPFEHVVRELNPVRVAGQNPVFGVLVEFENEAVFELDLPGVDATLLAAGIDKAPFDLALYLSNRPEGIRCQFEYDSALFDAATIEGLAAALEDTLAAAVDAPDADLDVLVPAPTTDPATTGPATAAAPAVDPAAWPAAGPAVDPAADLAAGPAAVAPLAAPVPVDPPLVHRRFATRAAADPDALAVVHGTRAVTYGGLAADVTALARRLRRVGVGPGTVVAVRVARSVELITAIVAVATAGGAVVPLDLLLGAHRARFLLDDSAATVLITDTDTDTDTDVDTDTDLGPVPGHVTVLTVTDPADPVAADPIATHPVGDDRPADDLGADDLGADDLGADDLDTDDLGAADGGATVEDLLYILYTSGSTGRPKGVAMPHRCLAGLVDWFTAAHPPLRTLQFASAGFDVAAQEIWTTLGAGATLVLLDEQQRYDPTALAGVVREHDVARVILPFTPLSGLLGQLVDDPAPHLVEVINTAERMRITPTVRRFVATHPDVALFNEYGPTETHLVTEHAVTDLEQDPVPIGVPVAGARIELLDADGAAVPSGAVGEVVLSGPGLAAGYHHRPDETARAFRTDPDPGAGPDVDSGVPDRRRYHTGDLARLRPDGALDYLGRADDQVKIRGWRVEPGEVEHVLAGLAGVRQAAVLARRDDPTARIGGIGPATVGGNGSGIDGGRSGGINGVTEEPYLAAYVVPDDPDGGPVAAELTRRWAAELRERLPYYLVPTRWTVLAALPLTPGGKLDRAALPVPPADPGPRHSAAPETDPVVADMVALWSAELGTPAHADASFFDLGGHSMLAMQLLGRIADAHGVDVPLLEFLRAPTVRAVADLVARRSGEIAAGRITGRSDHDPGNGSSSADPGSDARIPSLPAREAGVL